MNAKK